MIKEEPLKYQGKYEQFWFETAEYLWSEDQEKLVIKLKYSLDKKVFFTEVLTLPKEFAGRQGQINETFKKALQALHIIAGISYYKAYLPNKIAGLQLSPFQAAFWKKVYERGLGEFFYQNQIDFRGQINFPNAEVEKSPNQNEKLSGGGLVAIGGGKDSIVTAEILKKAGINFALFSLRDSEPVRDTAAIIEKERLLVDRQLDPLLFQLNQLDALNGHLPITAYISFLMVLCSAFYGYDKIVMSLEKSSNFGQFVYLGMDINHQYSKSEEFEKDFREYLGKYINSNLEYFSLLRQLDELKICQIFAQLENFEQYATAFASCNRNFKINKEKMTGKWCGECPKCAFVYLSLAAFLPKEKMLGIFGQDLLDKPELLGLFEEILGLQNFKPFECVGTPEESLAALYLISQKADYQDSLLVKKFNQEIKNKLENTTTFRGWDKLVTDALAIKKGGFLTERMEKLIWQYA